MNDEKIASLCWRWIDENAATFFISESFKHLEMNFLKKILTRRTLIIDEFVLFHAVFYFSCMYMPYLVALLG